MRYVTNVSINSATGNVASHAFRANSIYDPDSTGVGHQPSFYDQCAAIWNHYRVVRSHIKASFVNNGAAATLCSTVGVVLDDDGTVSTVLHDILEENSGVSSGMFRLSSTDAIASTELSYEESKFFGPRTPDTTGTFGANPGEVAYFVVFISPTDETTEIGPVIVQVEIDYDVECAELKDLVPSAGASVVTKGAPKLRSIPPVYKPVH